MAHPIIHVLLALLLATTPLFAGGAPQIRVEQSSIKLRQILPATRNPFSTIGSPKPANFHPTLKHYPPLPIHRIFLRRSVMASRNA